MPNSGKTYRCLPLKPPPTSHALNAPHAVNATSVLPAQRAVNARRAAPKPPKSSSLWNQQAKIAQLPHRWPWPPKSAASAAPATAMAVTASAASVVNALSARSALNQQPSLPPTSSPPYRQLPYWPTRQKPTSSSRCAAATSRPQPALARWW